MRALHVHRIAGIGGSERHLLSLLPGLAAEGVDVRFAGLDTASPTSDAFYAALAERGVPATRIPAARDVAPRATAALAREVRRFRPAIVHTHLVHADVAGSVAAAAAGARVVSTKHNADPFRTGAFRFVERALAARATRLIAITHELARFNVDHVGLPAEKIDVVHYGLDELPPAWGDGPAVAVPRGARLLLAVSRLVEQKGLDVAVRALARVRARHPGAVLIVLGEGPERGALERLAAETGLRDAVVLPGRAGDVAAWLRRAEVVVHPARWEGFGLVLLEAMLAARPVVGSDASAIREVVADGQTALLVPPDDPTALADAVARVLDDPELARRLGEAGLARARAEFSVGRMVAGTLAVYRRALS